MASDPQQLMALPAGVPRLGDILDGKCRIDGVLGIGGMGVVLAATHLHLDQRVAVKIMLPELARDPEIVERFVREGRAAVRIKSPHVAKVLDVATRLAEVHAKKIVHRDLKPSNLFLAIQEDRSTCLKVLDFGISKLVAVCGSRAQVPAARSGESLCVRARARRGARSLCIAESSGARRTPGAPIVASAPAGTTPALATKTPTKPGPAARPATSATSAASARPKSDRFE